MNGQVTYQFRADTKQLVAGIQAVGSEEKKLRDTVVSVTTGATKAATAVSTAAGAAAGAIGDIAPAVKGTDQAVAALTSRVAAFDRIVGPAFGKAVAGAKALSTASDSALRPDPAASTAPATAPPKPAPAPNGAPKGGGSGSGPGGGGSPPLPDPSDIDKLTRSLKGANVETYALTANAGYLRRNLVDVAQQGVFTGNVFTALAVQLPDLVGNLVDSGDGVKVLEKAIGVSLPAVGLLAVGVGALAGAYAYYSNELEKATALEEKRRAALDDMVSSTDRYKGAIKGVLDQYAVLNGVATQAYIDGEKQKKRLIEDTNPQILKQAAAVVELERRIKAETKSWTEQEFVKRRAAAGDKLVNVEIVELSRKLDGQKAALSALKTEQGAALETVDDIVKKTEADTEARNKNAGAVKKQTEVIDQFSKEATDQGRALDLIADETAKGYTAAIDRLNATAYDSSRTLSDQLDDLENRYRIDLNSYANTEAAKENLTAEYDRARRLLIEQGYTDLERQRATDLERHAATERAKQDATIKTVQNMSAIVGEYFSGTLTGLSIITDRQTQQISDLELRLSESGDTLSKERRRQIRNQIDDLQNAQRQAYRIEKVAKVSQAIILGRVAYLQALASAPPPMGPALAIATRVNTAATVAAIVAERPAFHSGGVVTADLLVGESVLNRTATDRIGRETIDDLNSGRAAPMGDTVVYIDGRLMGKYRDIRNGPGNVSSMLGVRRGKK